MCTAVPMGIAASQRVILIMREVVVTQRPDSDSETSPPNSANLSTMPN